MELSTADAKTAILLVISQIPPGRVASYGQVARMAGLQGRARLVGRILSKLPQDSTVPWFRVINANGKISFAVGSEAYRRQKKHLEREGVQFKGARIWLEKYHWNP